RDLLVEVGVAARFEKRHLDAFALRLFGDAVVDGEPIGILHMREGDADVPFLRRLVDRRVVDILARALHVEWRIPYLHREGIPWFLIAACAGKRDHKACKANPPACAPPERRHFGYSLSHLCAHSRQPDEPAPGTANDIFLALSAIVNNKY